MEHLPKNALANVATYLERTTRALLAVALTAPSSSWEEWDSTKTPSLASKFVMSSPYHKRWCRGAYEEKWDEFNFGAFSKNIRDKLSDADVCGILVCIDAANKLKNLWLTQCVSICGDGLAPLRGSTILEHIDLSLVKYGSPNSIEPTLLSEDKVLPILQSIIDVDGSSLKYLCLPKRWREGERKELGLLLQAYNRSLNRCNIGCSKCDRVCLGTNQRPWLSMQDEDYGVQNFTCQHWCCMKQFCADCEIHNDLQLCPYCEKKHCSTCATVKTCGGCHVVKCTACEDFYTCNICSKTECDGCDSTVLCDPCDRLICSACPHVKCKSCSESSCMECLNDGVGYVKRCSHCDETYCSTCREMEYCFRVGGDMCLDCHSKNHEGSPVECFWQALPSILPQLLPAFTTEISMDSLVRFWKECGRLVGTDKEYDLEIHKKNKQAIMASYVIAMDFLLKGCDREAVYMMFYAGFMTEISLRGPDYVVTLLEKKSAQPLGHLLCTYLSWFRTMIICSRTQASIVELIKEELPVFVEKYRGARRLEDMLGKVQTSKGIIHSSDEECKEDIPPEYGDSLAMGLSYWNIDSQKRFNWTVYKDATLGWLLKQYVIYCNDLPEQQSTHITPSTKYFRIVHKGKTVFLSSSGKKTLHELSIRDGDTITVGGIDLAESNKAGSTNGVSIKKGASKSKKSKKLRGPKKKKRSNALPIPMLTEDEIMEKHRETHSRAMSRVFEELKPLLKGIRNQLNDLTLLKSAPKARTSSTRKCIQTQATSARSLLNEDSRSGKAGKTCYPVLVGEVTNLYKTHKSSFARRPTNIDLHGYSKDEALGELDKILPAWVDAAMRSEYPWVIPVDIICGGGSQILSEAVKAWIRSKPQVANRPKNNG